MSRKKIIAKRKELHGKNFTGFGLDLNLTVTLLSALVLIAFSVYAFVNIETASATLEALKGSVLDRFSSLFVMASNLFIVVLILFALFNRSGKIRIGGDDAKPEFSRFAWYSMLMSAGMGIGLMFWSVGEPIFHDAYSPVFGAKDGLQGLATTFFHWTLHPWAIYTMIALAFGYFAYNKKLPLSPRSFFYPILKDRIFGFVGDLIDTLAVLAALVGLATSLGFGVQQINSGLTYIFGVPFSINIQVALIAGITGIATLSVVSGIDKGVKFLSELNIRAAGLLMLLIFILGPSAQIIKNIVAGTGVFAGDLIRASTIVHLLDSEWAQGWTIFYWAWWISWSPFVGMFIAKISKGRTVREFITATMFVPTILSILWLGTFGTTALSVDAASQGALGAAVNAQISTALFEMIELMSHPLLVPAVSVAVQGLALFLVISFFVTSSDSGSLVVDSLASGGKIHSPVGQRVFWAVMEGVIAAVLLVVGGTQALTVLQTAVIITGLPFALIIGVVTVLLIKEFYLTPAEQPKGVPSTLGKESA